MMFELMGILHEGKQGSIRLGGQALQRAGALSLNGLKKKLDIDSSLAIKVG